MFIGIAMGLTAIGLIFSPLGKRSGAHMNPAVTLTFLRLGKMKPWDAFFYIVAQFVGGVTGVVLTSSFIHEWFADPSVNYVVTIPGSGGAWVVVSDMDKAFEKLRTLKVGFVSTGPQRLPDWNIGAAGIKAFYFRDPDQHNLEVIYFPAGKGDPRWQEKTDKLFLGIDHTAIAVTNTDASLHFYHDLLGFHKAGESENFGTEQEHLNQVFGAHLRITSVRAMSGPGIEFLEYLTPRDGRPRPHDAKANDLIHWQPTLVTPDIEEFAHALRAGHVNFVSTAVTIVPKDKLRFNKGLLIRDPDGHALLLTQE
jgi:catechol 2,3-dioxygenase-like lactoylglutathione lyase family enzyme